MHILDVFDTTPHVWTPGPVAVTVDSEAVGQAPLRIGFDMDGVLADLSSAYLAVEERLFGAAPARPAVAIEPDMERFATDRSAADAEGVPAADVPDARLRARAARRRRKAVWHAIESTPDFWMTLRPLEEGSIRRVQAMALRYRWEVFFITQRPRTDGDTVQRQSQRWLVEQGFALPSVLVLGGSRGAAAGVLRLNYHLDDSPQNCLDVLGESTARPILVVPDNDERTVRRSRNLGIGTADSLTACLDILERATLARDEPDVLADLAATVGWR